LQKEVSALLEWLRVIPYLTLVKPAQRTDCLTWAKRELIIAAVLRQYVLMDEHLNNEICWEFFPRPTYPRALADRAIPRLQ
jgi:hypothetical protein